MQIMSKRTPRICEATHKVLMTLVIYYLFVCLCGESFCDNNTHCNMSCHKSTINANERHAEAHTHREHENGEKRDKQRCGDDDKIRQ